MTVRLQSPLELTSIKDSIEAFQTSVRALLEIDKTVSLRGGAETLLDLE